MLEKHQPQRHNNQEGGKDGKGGILLERYTLDVLKLATDHLPHFDEYRNVVCLIGDEYIPIIKCKYYGLISVIIAKQEITLGEIKTDCRLHNLLPIPSGRGKRAFKTADRKILQGVSKNVEEPTSIHHEQLVGKVVVNVKGNKRTYTEIPGYFSRDYLLIDEANPFLLSEDIIYQESRKYLRFALDPYPDNVITKKSVDVDFSNQLQYSPYCCTTLFVQPISLPDSRVYDGDLRRFIIPYVNLLEIDQREALIERIRSTSDTQNVMKAFVNFLSSLIPSSPPPPPIKFSFSDKAVDKFEQLSMLLIDYGNQYSEKIANYMHHKDFTIQDFLAKFSVIQAFINNRTDISDKDVELAFTDYFESLTLEFDFIETKVGGHLDYGGSWKGAMGEDQKCLHWLWKKGAISFEKSSVNIKNYEEEIASSCKIQAEAARKRYYNHQKKGWVEGKQVGSHDSKVWLTFTPKFKRITSRDKITEVYETYISILRKYNLTDNIPPLPPSEPVDKTGETSKKGATTLIPPLTSGSEVKIPEGGITL